MNKPVLNFAKLCPNISTMPINGELNKISEIKGFFFQWVMLYGLNA